MVSGLAFHQSYIYQGNTCITLIKVIAYAANKEKLLTTHFDIPTNEIKNKTMYIANLSNHSRPH